MAKKTIINTTIMNVNIMNFLLVGDKNGDWRVLSGVSTMKTLLVSDAPRVWK